MANGALCSLGVVAADGLSNTDFGPDSRNNDKSIRQPREKAHCANGRHCTRADSPYPDHINKAIGHLHKGRANDGHG